MKRYQSAFAVPSGFAVAATSKAKAARRADAFRAADAQSVVPKPMKARAVHDIQDRAA